MCNKSHYIISAWPTNSFEAMALYLSYKTYGYRHIFFRDLENKVRMVGVRNIEMTHPDYIKRVKPVFDNRLHRIYINPHSPEPLYESLWSGLKDQNGNIVKRGVLQVMKSYLKNVSQKRWERFCQEFEVTYEGKLIRRQKDDESASEEVPEDVQVMTIEQEREFRDKLIEQQNGANKKDGPNIRYLRRRIASDQYEQKLKREYLRNLYGYYVVYFNGLMHEYAFVKEGEVDTFLASHGLHRETRGAYRPLQSGEYRKWKYTSNGENKRKVVDFLIKVDQPSS